MITQSSRLAVRRWRAAAFSGSTIAVGFLCLISVSLAASPVDAVAKKSFFFRHELSDGYVVKVDLPGEQQYAIETRSRIRIPVYDEAQAATLAVELALVDRANFLPQLLCGQRYIGEPELTPDVADNFALCLEHRTGTRGKKRLFTLPGEPRYAIRDDGEPLLLFTKPQCDVLLRELVASGVQVPIAAGILSGFKAAPPSTRSWSTSETPIRPGCGECAPGRVCTIGEERDCCTSGEGSCQACRSCLTLRGKLEPQSEPAP